MQPVISTLLLMCRIQKLFCIYSQSKYCIDKSSALNRRRVTLGVFQCLSHEGCFAKLVSFLTPQLVPIIADLSSEVIRIKLRQTNIVSERGTSVEDGYEKWNFYIPSFSVIKTLKHKNYYIISWVHTTFRVLHNICGMKALIFEVKAVWY